MIYIRDRQLRSPFRPSLLCIVLFAKSIGSSFTSEPRWGQATAIVNNLLFISGGKTDEFGAYSYTSAPTTNDLFTLDLSLSFDPSSPPWSYLSGSQDSSTAQGQELAWHSLSAYNTTQLLLFGGDGGPNSPIVLPSGSDSAHILNINENSISSWNAESDGWAGQPSRRIHHSASSVGGKVYIFGGEKDDGSSIGYPDHYIFDPSVPSFKQLPSDNGPPDIYGHASVVLSDGRILVFGGYSASESRLIPFSTIWSIDTTQSSLSWSLESVSDVNLPVGRRAFACTWIEGDRILIHGGSDNEFQTTYSDGWILDTTSSPMSWTNISVLTQIGVRRDHSAVQVGSQVIIGFGYGTNAGASTELLIYDYSKNEFTSTFTPQSNPSQTTLPASSGTGSPSSGNSHTVGSGTSTTSHGGSHSTGNPSSPSETVGTGNNDKETAVIAVASVLGVLAVALAVGIVVVIIIRRKRSQQRFHLLSDDEEGGPGPEMFMGISILSWFKARRGLAKGEKVRMREPEGWTILGLSRRLREASSGSRRRIDMFANEDASEFAVRHVPRHFRTGSSRSWVSISDTPHERYGSLVSERRSIGRLFSGSLKHVGNGVKRIVSGGSSRGHEKEVSLPLETFDDSEGLLNDKSEVYVSNLGSSEATNEVMNDLGDNTSVTPLGARQELQQTSSYSNPFQDKAGSRAHSLSVEESLTDNVDSVNSERGNVENSDPSEMKALQPSFSLQTFPTATSSKFTIESSSVSYIQDGSTSDHSSISIQTPISQMTPARPRTTSILDPIDPINSLSSPVKRSDSWWSRLKRSSLRDQSTNELRTRPPTNLDFRDPNPPPVRLGAIREASCDSSARPRSSIPFLTENTRKGRSAFAGIYSDSRHEQSKTSLKTNQTADSAALERIAGHVVILREGTNSTTEYSPSYTESIGRRHTRSEFSSTFDRDSGLNDNYLLYDTDSQDITSGHSRPYIGSIPNLQPENSLLAPDTHESDKPADMPRNKEPISSPPLRPVANGRVSVSNGFVANRIAEYERRMSLDSSVPRDPVSPTKRSSKPIDMKYSLVHRPDLFVTNPDNHSISERSDN